ncbi:MAG: hypothetical protein H7Y09_01705 [Chitinophagaceae bacterium]|nr:hypothetical protein [Anaerolineae bacterium]
MTTKTRESNADASRISKLSAAYRKHQPAIQSVLERRAQAQWANMRVIETTAQDGTLYRIGCTTHGYKVVGVEQGRCQHEHIKSASSDCLDKKTVTS